MYPSLQEWRTNKKQAWQTQGILRPTTTLLFLLLQSTLKNRESKTILAFHGLKSFGTAIRWTVSRKTQTLSFHLFLLTSVPLNLHLPPLLMQISSNARNDPWTTQHLSQNFFKFSDQENGFFLAYNKIQRR